MKRVTLTIGLGLLLATAQVTASDQRLKVGLALSGGGTKAGAHLGVLKVLEELNVPIDYIAGTSAGAIIGGLYAAGMSADEIEEAIDRIDWDDMLRDAPPRAELPFRRKRDDANYLVKSRPGFNDGRVRLPLGVIQGQKVTRFFRDQLSAVADVSHFDDLPIPFRAIATDLETGVAVVLGDGDLSTAVRASMSIPAVFAPVKTDGMILVDGGVANNLPIDVVRAMGADVVIAVDITAPLHTAEALDSVVLVADQLSNFLTRRNVDQQIATLTPRDILLAPVLEGLGGLDFEHTLVAVAPGIEAARAASGRLAKLALGSADYERHIVARRLGAVRGSRTVEFVRINHDSGLGTAIISNRLGVTIGEPLNTETLDQGVTRLYGLQLFERVDYEIVEEGGATGVVVEAVPKSWGPNYLQFGLTLSEDFSSDADFNLGVAYLRTAVNELGGEWRAQLDIGAKQGISVEWYQPLSPNRRFFIEPSARYLRQNIKVYDGEPQARAEIRLDGWGGSLSGGVEIAEYGELRAGISRFAGDIDLRVGTLDTPDDRFDIGEIFATALLDRLDNNNFPRRGTAAGLGLVLSRDGIGSDVDYEQVSGQILNAKTWGRNTLVSSIEYGTTLDEDAPPESLFALGGLGRLSGYQTDRFLGQHYALASLVAFRELRRSSILPIYAGFSLEAGNTWDRRSNIGLDDLRVASAIYAGADTPIGPFYLAGAYAEGGEWTAYLVLGNPFVSAGRRILD